MTPPPSVPVHPDYDLVDLLLHGAMWVGGSLIVLVLVSMAHLAFMAFHGPYHIQITTEAGEISYEEESALFFAEQLVDRLQQAHPAWTVRCMDCTLLSVLSGTAWLERLQVER